MLFVGIKLFRAARVAIKRHVKIRSASNPYDPQWEAYFTRRRLRFSAKLPGPLLGC